MQDERKWYEPLKFAEAWYFLNLVGFRMMPYHKESVIDPTKPKSDDYFPLRKVMKWRKHQDSYYVKWYLEGLFADRAGGFRFSKFSRPLRDKRIQIPAPKTCTRCHRRKALQRDHIVPLHLGGKDVVMNLQYLCAVCHRFKTAKDKIDKELDHFHKGGWRWKMWSYRLDALTRLNPPGAEEYCSYWSDPKTHYDRWYERAPKKSAPPVTLEAFSTFHPLDAGITASFAD